MLNKIVLAQMLNRNVVVLCNLKPAKLKGIESRGMVLCASRDDPKEVEPLLPPEGSVAGDRIFVEGYEGGTPDEQLNPKRKVWEKIAVDMKTNAADGKAQWAGNNLLTAKGEVVAKTVKGAPIK